MTAQFKAFLIAIPCLILMAIIAAYDHGEQTTAISQALTPEQQTRQKIRGLQEYTYGQTADHQTALQLTIQHDLFGLRNAATELASRAADDIHNAYQIHRDLETIDIQYDVKVTNAYGETSYSPALYIEMDLTTYQRVNWQNFNPVDLPKITPLEYLRPL